MVATASFSLVAHSGAWSLTTHYASCDGECSCLSVFPFGEELSAGVGGRTTGQGYSQFDGNRKKWALLERDDETGLDYAQARYYSSVQGRFASVDPENAGAEPVNPQSLNGYAYALNNPVVFGDPDGLSVRICDANGDCENVSDETANRYLLNKNYQRAEGLTVKDNKIFQNGQQIGTYVIGPIDGAPFSAALPEAGRYPYGKALLAFEGLSIAGGLGLYAAGATGGGALTTLGLGGETAAATAPGLLSGSLAGLTQAERAMVQELLSQGKSVHIISRGASKTADFLINGVRTELKTLANAGTNTLKNAIQTAAKQGEQILIDARNVGITPRAAAQQIQRAQGNIGGLSGRVTVLTKGGTVKF